MGYFWQRPVVPPPYNTTVYTTPTAWQLWVSADVNDLTEDSEVRPGVLHFMEFPLFNKEFNHVKIGWLCNVLAY